MAPPVQAAIRSACDRCHAKKVRCLVTDNEGTCDRCKAQNAQCVFGPAGRNGRPPRAQATSDSDQSSVRPQNNRRILALPSGSAADPQNGQPNHTGPTAALPTDFAWDTFDFESAIGDCHSFDQHTSLDPSLINSDMDFISASNITAGELALPNPVPMTPTSSSEHRSIGPSQPESRGSFSEQPSASDTLRLLHQVQQKLRDVNTSNQSRATLSCIDGTIEVGVFFKLMDDMLKIVGGFLSQLSEIDAEVSFDLAMNLGTTMGNVVEVLEYLAHFITPGNASASGVASAHGTASSRRPSTADTMADVTRASGSSSAGPGSRSPRLQRTAMGGNSMNVRIGSHVPDEATARGILTKLLGAYLVNAKTQINGLRQHLTQASLASSANATASAMPQPRRHRSTSCVRSSTPDAQTPVFFTSDLHWSVVQILNQLQTRLASLQPRVQQ
ncbi:hypothetical protein EJ03DRAFT_347845 [Teratosphaeria nubilosa]|uniref:Zn(2)-C6 fungal-type domain-containing protein n=1 Tax=Teratosphaeria nubilosa TaxID=161662 RepID=A0A6G1LK47_9PEZI|nr:hypothetical protein EJ03DRAFT_347845 [Teratosphaeria nubilosa]